MFDQVRKNREATEVLPTDTSPIAGPEPTGGVAEPTVLSGIAVRLPGGPWAVDPSADPKVFTEPAQWKSYATSYIEDWVSGRRMAVDAMRAENGLMATNTPPTIATPESEISDIERLIDVAQEVLTLRDTEGDTSMRASQISS